MEVRFELFANTGPVGKDLVLQWHRRAKAAATGPHFDCFDAFTRLWLGFNNWRCE